ncbi:MAG: NAD-dependent epimerase/dehydratase family protein [Patescibacteria group bacterium]
MTEAKQKVVVTGGAGFIGSHLVEALIEKGFQVDVIDNLVAGKREQVDARAVLHVVDIRDLDAILPIIDGAFAVFHLAALPSVPYSIENPKETHEVNVTGTLNILLASARGKVKRVIYSSSSAVYGDQTVLPICEDARGEPKSPYGLHKRMGEEYMALFAELYGVETVSLRYFNLYGPRQKSEGAYASVVAKFIACHNADESLPIVGDGTQTRDFVHVSDVVRANISAMESEQAGSGEVVNIGGGVGLSVLEVARLVGGKMENTPPRVEIRDSVADIKRAQKLLGWSPSVKVEDGINILLRSNLNKKI